MYANIISYYSDITILTSPQTCNNLIFPFSIEICHIKVYNWPSPAQKQVEWDRPTPFWHGRTVGCNLFLCSRLLQTFSVTYGICLFSESHRIILQHTYSEAFYVVIVIPTLYVVHTVQSATRAEPVVSNHVERAVKL
jgi:hypothetical protein